MIADSSGVEAALVALLAGDPALTALVPDGVYVDVAPANAQRFIIVSRLSPASQSTGFGDIATFTHGRTAEDYYFLVKAVMLSTAGGDIRAAAFRIDELLEDRPLAPEGFIWSTTYRDEHIRVTEPDSLDPSIRWLHRGGRYRVQLAVA